MNLLKSIFIGGVNMLVHSNNQASHIYQAQSNTPIRDANTTVNNKNTADKVTISDAGLNAESKWQKIANQYDPTNMSYNNLANMVTDLRKNELITSGESLALLAPPSMNFDPNEKYNTVALARKSVEFDQSLNTTNKDAQLRAKSLSILETIQDLSRNSTV